MIMIQGDKSKYLPNHSVKQRMESLKGNSFIHQSRRLLREQQPNLLTKTLPCCPTNLPQLWNDEQANLQISLSIPRVTITDSQDGIVKRSLTMAMISIT